MEKPEWIAEEGLRLTGARGALPKRFSAPVAGLGLKLVLYMTSIVSAFEPQLTGQHNASSKPALKLSANIGQAVEVEVIEAQNIHSTFFPRSGKNLNEILLKVGQKSTGPAWRGVSFFS